VNPTVDPAFSLMTKIRMDRPCSYAMARLVGLKEAHPTQASPKLRRWSTKAEFHWQAHDTSTTTAGAWLSRRFRRMTALRV
jgi:hypothetical protein